MTLPSADVLQTQHERPSPRLATVILNTDRCDDTLACLDSMARQSIDRNQVIVLDNCSNQDCSAKLSRVFPQVTVIRLESNRGYAGNNNVGIEVALKEGVEWILILNEDVVLDPRAVELLLEAVADRSDVGIVGPMVYHADEPTVIQSAGGILSKRWLAFHRGQNEEDKGQFAQAGEVDWISGCAILVRREVVEEVGAFDERFFYYWEETEWCLRARRAGWKILFVPQARIWHKGVQRNYEPSPSITYYWTRNWLMSLAKHHAPVSAWLFAVATIARTLTSWTLKPSWAVKREHRDAMLQGSLDFLRQRWGRRPAHQ